MKNILIVISSFRWGGINRSLQSWLNAISPDNYQVDLFVLVHSGNYSGTFSNCTLLPKNKYLNSILDHRSLQKGWAKILFYALRALNKISSGRFQHWLYKVVGNRLVDKRDYDAVIAWGEGVPTAFVSHIKHSNKIAWIHCDYTQYTNGPTEKAIYDRYKSIVCVSKYTRGTFLSYYPGMESKVHAIYNILDVDEIRRLSKEPMDVEYDKDVFNIVSVGRVAPVKRFSMIPSIARKLKDAGCKFTWYIVGPYYGNAEYLKIIEDIYKYDLKDNVKMLGGKTNPFPYIANADLHVCTSLSESWSYTINEASVLGIPSVSTDFGAVYESIENEVTGFISPLEEIHLPIIKMINDGNLYFNVKNSLIRFKNFNESSIWTLKLIMDQ